MLYLYLSLHRWKQLIRSATAGRRLLSTLAVALVGVYFALMLLSLGLAYPQIARDIAPERDPFRLLNEYLLTAFLGLLAARFFLQRSPGTNLTPYLHLPLRRRNLVRFEQTASLFSLLNVLPFFFFVPLWIDIIRTAAPSIVGAAFWGFGIVLLVALTHHANVLLRELLNRRTGLFLSVISILVGMLTLDEMLSLRIVPHASAWLFDGLLTGHVMPLLPLAILTISAAIASSGLLYRSLRAAPESHQRAVNRVAGPLRGRSLTTTLMLLDLKLIVRNKRPRQQVLSTILLVVAFPLLVLSGDEMTGPLMQTLLGIYITGAIALTHGQLMFSWEGAHFDGLMSHPLPTRLLIRARLVLLQGICVLSFLIVIPILAWLIPQWSLLHIAFLLYNIGVTCTFITFVALWNRKRATLSQSAFLNYQVFSVHHYIFVLFLFIPPLIALFLLPKVLALILLAGLGLLSLLLTPFWLNGFGRLFQHRKYIMAAGFRQTD